MLSHCSLPYMQVLATKGCECPGPWLEPTQAIADFLCGLAKVDPAILFLEDRRERCFSVILRARRDCARIEPAQSVDHEIGTDCGQRWSQRFGGIRRIDWSFFLQQDV